jgi:pimeloyl-ACP methyl ester carboxylesterase
LIKPVTQYARSGELHIAFQVFGDADLDIVLVRGYATHMDLSWEWPGFQRIMDRLGAFARVIFFDKRGTGLSDPVEDVPSLEERMDDVRAVMDAAGSDRAALWGFSEGGAMAMLFAATYPDRTSHLVLYSTIARTTWAPDYPWATPAESLVASMKELIVPEWGRGTNIEVWIPSLADNSQAVERWGKYERQAASPGMFMRLNRMFLDVDVRHILPAIRVPTLVLHRRHDRVVNIVHGRYVAERIPHARFVELPGIDHALEVGDTEVVLDEVERFLTGAHRAGKDNRVLATVMFTDLVSSTHRAASVGDKQWLDLLGAHQLAVRTELDRFRGREVKTTGDGFLATFDGPARAIRCGQAIVEALKPLNLEVRVGLHTGEVELIDEDIGGIAVHIASRIGGLAESGEVLVSETIKGIVAGSGIAFKDRGQYELKGLPETWRIYEVVA